MIALPSVTVIMAAYNSALFIHKAIESLQQQTLSDWEVIVADDCSTDNTGAVVQALAEKDSRIIYCRMPENKGPAAARNLAMRMARGAWVTILDSDDRYEPDRLRSLVDQAEALQADVVADNILYYDQWVHKIVRTAFVLDKDSLHVTPELLVQNDGPPRLFSCGLLKPMFRKSFLDTHAISYAEDLRVGEDFVFLFDLLRKGARAVIFNKPGYIYTMPYGTQSRKESTTSRTDYNVEGWDRLLRANQNLLDQVKAETPGNATLMAALRKREARFLREISWQKCKAQIRRRNALAVMCLMADAGLVLHLCGRAGNRFKASERVG